MELQFTPKAGVAYRLWIRGKAQNDDPFNDSVFVQFDNSTDEQGVAKSRIGTTSAEVINLEDCFACGLSGWGWQDNGWGVGVLGPLVYFPTGGVHKLRIQPREDGLSIDQVVLSPNAFLTTAPGAVVNDNTILPKNDGSTPTPTPTNPTPTTPTPTPTPSPTPTPAPGDVVLYASEGMRVGNYILVNDATAAGGVRLHNPDAGAAKLANALDSPGTYVEMQFTAQAGTAYRLWIRGKAENDDPFNDSVFVQFDDSVDVQGLKKNRIGGTGAEVINLEDCFACGLSGWGWQDNGWGVGVLGPLVFFETSGVHTLRIQPREDGLSIDQIVLSPQTYVSTRRRRERQHDSRGERRYSHTDADTNSDSDPHANSDTYTNTDVRRRGAVRVGSRARRQLHRRGRCDRGRQRAFAQSGCGRRETERTAGEPGQLCRTAIHCTGQHRLPFMDTRQGAERESVQRFDLRAVQRQR